MRRILSPFFLLSFLLTTAVPGIAEADAYQFSAYKRPGDRAWNRSWTLGLLASVTAQKGRLEKARDLEDYCPGYQSASVAQQTNCFVRLFSGISAWESSNSPTVTGDGGVSVGLVQIGVFNCKREGMDAAALKVPVNNLRCGTRFAADLIARDGVISSESPATGRWGTVRVKRRGLGRGGWSVMMANQTVTYRGRSVQVGRLQQIASGMKTYLEPGAGTQAVLEKKKRFLA